MRRRRITAYTYPFEAMRGASKVCIYLIVCYSHGIPAPPAHPPPGGTSPCEALGSSMHVSPIRGAYRSMGPRPCQWGWGS
eukprot:8128212-Pyramimonas_sp.AAC.1